LAACQGTSVKAKSTAGSPDPPQKPSKPATMRKKSRVDVAAGFWAETATFL